MDLPFLNRTQELRRLTETAFGSASGFACVYGRRRLGKSRLLREAGTGHPAAFYVGDDRDAALQRSAVASEIARHLPGFDAVDYQDWGTLLDRFWRDAPTGLTLILDEFPALVAAAPELPSVLQKLIDRQRRGLVLCGSSQRMMHGLVLDATAPLFGRAEQILRIGPLDPQWILPALQLRSPADAVEQYACWGGVPRYWELARACRNRGGDPLDELVLDPLGVLHNEPDRLLADDLEKIRLSASLLALIGQGCTRLSEIAGRLQTNATTLSRPLARLIDLGLVHRDIPFGRSTRDSKRTLYRIADPFLSLWYRFVEPNRSRLAAGQRDLVRADVDREWPRFLGQAWETLARDSVARLEIGGTRWRPASRFWGPSTERTPIEIDLVAEHATDPERMLVGEVKLSASAKEARELLAALERKAAICPPLAGKQVTATLWVLRRRGRIDDERVVGPDAVMTAPQGLS